MILKTNKKGKIFSLKLALLLVSWKTYQNKMIGKLCPRDETEK